MSISIGVLPLAYRVEETTILPVSHTQESIKSRSLHGMPFLCMIRYSRRFISRMDPSAGFSLGVYGWETW